MPMQALKPMQFMPGDAVADVIIAGKPEKVVKARFFGIIKETVVVVPTIRIRGVFEQLQGTREYRLDSQYYVDVSP